VSEDQTNIVSSVVPDKLRINFLPRYLGAHFLRGESMVYDWASRLSHDYQGGSWHFFELSNGGFYMAPAHAGPTLRVQWHGNGYDDTMGADAFGVVVTLFALCHLAEKTGNDKIIDHYHALREYAMTHAEAAEILQAID
jgi:hypothetical protein